MPTALITGGGGAIAFEIASRLQAKGYRLILVDYYWGRMEESGGKLNSPQLIRVDLSDASDVENLAQRIGAGDLDVDFSSTTPAT